MLLLRLFVLIGLPLIVYAQVDTGSITGIVRDPSGAVVQNAEINITNAATGISVALQSNGDGLYSTPNLKSGVYNVSASASGFSTVTRSGIEVHLQDRVTVDFELPLGQTSNSVSVESSVTALETETSSLGQVVEERAIKNLPLNGRNYIQLATLAAGASPSQRSNERNALVANGARSIQNSYLLDGIDNKNKIVGFDSSVAQSIEPVLDSVQEFNVQTSSFSAEFGQSAGAIVNVTTKSGTNQLHGSAFEFLRNSFLDASPYFQPANTANPQFIQNQFGATLGGPIIKDRTFFFFGWQSSREVNAAPQLASVPTDAQKMACLRRPFTIPPPRSLILPAAATYEPHLQKPGRNFHRGFNYFEWVRGQEIDYYAQAPRQKPDFSSLYPEEYLKHAELSRQFGKEPKQGFSDFLNQYTANRRRWRNMGTRLCNRRLPTRFAG